MASSFSGDFLSFGAFGFVNHGSMAMVVPPGVRTTKAACPHHVSSVAGFWFEFCFESCAIAVAVVTTRRSKATAVAAMVRGMADLLGWTASVAAGLEGVSERQSSTLHDGPHGPGG